MKYLVTIVFVLFVSFSFQGYSIDKQSYYESTIEPTVLTLKTDDLEINKAVVEKPTPLIEKCKIYSNEDRQFNTDKSTRNASLWQMQRFSALNDKVMPSKPTPTQNKPPTRYDNSALNYRGKWPDLCGQCHQFNKNDEFG